MGFKFWDSIQGCRAAERVHLNMMAVCKAGCGAGPSAALDQRQLTLDSLENKKTSLIVWLLKHATPVFILG